MPRPLTFTVATGGADTSIPTGPQISAAFSIVGPDGTRVSFNDPNDRDYVGMLTEISGFDAPDLRESTDDLIQQDGGIHGDFFFGRRPITLSGIILNPVSADARNRRMTRMMRACRALRSDATVQWVLEGGYEQYLKVRLQNGPRFEGGYQKSFQVGFVAADPRIYSTTPKTAILSGTGSFVATNNGNAEMFPQITIYGPYTAPTLQNYTAGATLSFNYSLASGQYLAIDAANKLIVLNGTTPFYSSLITTGTLPSTWWGILPGDNDLRVTGGAGSVVVEYRDAWL